MPPQDANPTPSFGGFGLSRGGEFTYTIVVTNASQETASGVNVSDSLPSEVALLTSTATRGQYDSGTGLWTVGVLVPGQSETLTLEVRVDAEAFGVISNTAVASSDKSDPEPQNNEATADTVVLTTGQTALIPMGVGFNLIGLPVRFPTPLTAREFSDLVDAQGGTVAAILRWDAGYEAWLREFPDEKNFVLEEGRGYFVRLSKSPANDQLSVTGVPFTAGVPVDLGVGFNLLSVPFASPAGGYDSRTLVQAIDPNGLDLGGVVAAVLSWDAGYEAYLTDVPDEKIFPIEAFRGYFVRMAQERLGFVP